MYYELLYKSVETGSETNEIIKLSDDAEPSPVFFQEMLDQSKLTTTGIDRKYVKHKAIDKKNYDLLAWILQKEYPLFPGFIDWGKKRKELDRLSEKPAIKPVELVY